MFKASVLLLSDRNLEARIIENFLQTAGYRVLNYSDSSLTPEPEQAARADAAVLALDDAHSSLEQSCDLLRKMAHAPNLPIVAVISAHDEPPRPQALHSPSTVEGVRVLVRPIRLFELAHSLEQALRDRPRDSGNHRIGNGEPRMERVREYSRSLERWDMHARR